MKSSQVVTGSLVVVYQLSCNHCYPLHRPSCIDRLQNMNRSIELDYFMKFLNLVLWKICPYSCQSISV